MQRKLVVKQYLRVAYRQLINSPFWKPLHIINDMFYVFRYLLMGKKKISDCDICNVENNVTFIYKSFNRQKQAKRLYRCIRSYYPKARIIIADDSRDPLIIDGAEIIYLPFNSGLSIGLMQALDRVKTPFVMRMDDDELLTPHTNVHNQLSYLQSHPEIDLVGFQVSYKNPERMAHKYSHIKMNKTLIIPAGTMIDGKEVIYKSPNVFLARTEKLKLVGYDPNIRMNDHHEFFYRAAGKIVSVQDSHSYVMHCHNRFEREYDQYRRDTAEDALYIRAKHGENYYH